MELTESETILAVLRELAKTDRINEFPNLLQLWFKSYPHTEDFVRARIPALMLENYFFRKKILSPDHYKKWCQSWSKSWATQLSDIASKDNFASQISTIETAMKRL